MRKRLFLIIILAVSAGTIGRAQELSIAASPIRVEHLIKQGEQGTDVITLINMGTQATRLKASVEEWIIDAKGTPLFTKPAGIPYSCASWIKINPVDFRIDPGQTKEIRYSVSCPQGVSDGGYRAAILFATVADVKPGEVRAKVMLQSRIAVILYEKVGTPQIAASVESVKTRSRSDGLDFILEIANTGATYFRTKGKLTVKDSGGNKMFELDIPDAPVLQDVRRLLEVSYTGPLAKGTYTVQTIMDLGAKELIGAEAKFTVAEDIPKK
jgi:P pilus assembly chaperone PapD